MSDHQLAGFDPIILRLRDKVRMAGLYTEVLGCSVDRDLPEQGLAHLRAGVNLIDLVTVDGPLGAHDDGLHLYLQNPEGNAVGLKTR